MKEPLRIYSHYFQSNVTYLGMKRDIQEGTEGVHVIKEAMGIGALFL